jgi:hypothetical protein
MDDEQQVDGWIFHPIHGLRARTKPLVLYHRQYFCPGCASQALLEPVSTLSRGPSSPARHSPITRSFQHPGNQTCRQPDSTIFHKALDDRTATNRNRRLRSFDIDEDPAFVMVDGARCLNACSNDYLNLSRHPGSHIGCNGSMHKLWCGHLRLHDS